MSSAEGCDMGGHEEFPRVELRGHQLDLKNLVAFLRVGDHRVVLENDLYWLHSTDFDGLAGDPDKARAKAETLLPLINALAKARIPSFEPLELGECVDWIGADGRPKRRLTARIILRVRSSEQIGDVTSINTQIAEWMAVARDHGPVFDALRLWGSARTHDWSSRRSKRKWKPASGLGL
jgi:hypothetical protein